MISGTGILLLQVWSWIKTGNWKNYTLIDAYDHFGWDIPDSISDQQEIDYIWSIFLMEGSLALTLLLYVPLLIILLGLPIGYVLLWIDETRQG